MDFSQRKKAGFRNRFEFDKKRIFVADDRNIKVLGYSSEMNAPFEIAWFYLENENE